MVKIYNVKPMKHIYKKLLAFSIFFCSLLLLSSELKASHIMGSDLSFRCIGRDSFIVRLSLYRDCSGIALGATQTVRVASASCGRNFNITVTRLAGWPIEVSPICPSRISSSTCRGGSVPGVEEHIYEGLAILPARCTDWTFSWTTCCRNPAITTITSPDSRATYIEATYNNTVYDCNNSPDFTSLPVPFICNNTPFIYNHGAVDADRDSLYYQIVPCNTTSATAFVPYIPPRTGLSPLATASPVTIDPLNGNVFLYPNAIQVGIMAILVQEFRDGVLIGSTMRDIQVTVLRCDNIAPVLDTITSAVGGQRMTPYRYHVCADDSISFNVVGRDTIIDSITMTSNIAIAIPGASFATPPPDTPSVVGTFSWRPTDADLGLHSFTITLRDNACPVFGTTIVAYDVVVVGVAVDAPDTQYTCFPPGDTFTLNARGSASTYTWRVLSGDTASLVCSTCNPIRVYPTRTTTYEVEGVTAMGCANKDTVTVVVTPLMSITPLRDTTVCRGSPVRLNPNPTPAASYNYMWFPRAGLSDSTAAAPIATPSVSTTYHVRILSGGLGGCEKWDTVRITVVNGGIFPREATICVGQTYTLGSRTYPGPGIYRDTFPTTLAGCDSIFEMRVLLDTSVRFLRRQADTLVCIGSSTSINNIIVYDTIIKYDTLARCDSYLVSSIPFAPEVPGSVVPLNLATSVATSHAIGFTFNFFCTNYTQFYASVNGFITFTGGSSTGCCTGQLLPTGTAPNNLIAFGWNNYTRPAGPGIMEYFVLGTAPNRRLVINYKNMPHQTAGDGDTLTTQVILYETTNIIEIHTTNVEGYYTGGSNGHTWGIENITGTRAFTPPGRNRVEGINVVNESWRFSPYRYGSPRKIPLNISWSPTSGLVPSNRVNPTATLSTPTTYVLTIFDSLCYFHDTVSIGIRAKDTINQSLTLCQGSVVNVGTRSYTTSGFYRDTLRNTNGCDSFVNTTLTIIRADSLLQTIIICDDSSWTFNGRTRNTSGVYRDSFLNVYGCDSTIITTLIVNARSFVTQNFTLCIGSSVTVGTRTYSTSGTYRDTLTNIRGCDSIITTNLTINPISTRTINVSFCIGDTLRVGTSQYTTSGTRYDTLTNYLGCDSIVTSNLTVHPVYVTTVPVTICYDQFYFAQGANQNTSNVYFDSLLSVNGCDSVKRTVLTVIPLVSSSRSITICFGDSVVLQGGNRGSSGTYYDTLLAFSGCDSLLITNLIVNPHSYRTLNPTICNGTSYSVGTSSYTAGGTYYDTLVNYLGCDSVVTTNLTVDTVLLSFSKRDVRCNNGSDGQITASASGGTMPYEFNIGGAWQFSPIFTNVSAGTYTLSVRTFTGCTTSSSVTITQPPRIGPSIVTNTPTSCNGSSDGSVQIGVTAGTAPFQYSINRTSFQVSPILSGLAAGNYRAYVQDSLGCLDSIDYVITEPSPVLITITPTHNKCHNDATGRIIITPRGGTSPYQYSIDGGSTFVGTNAFDGLTSGTYAIVVKDFRNCVSTGSVTLNNPPLFVINASGINVQCWDSDNGKITINPTGGTTPYTSYEYSQNGIVFNTGSSPEFTLLNAGFYYVRATDANGCIANDTAVIGRPPIDTFAFIIDSTSCYGAQYTDGSILVLGSANPPYTYSVDGGPGQLSPMFYGLGAGNHTIVATNGFGCIDTLIQFVPFPPPVIVDVVPDTVFLSLGGSQQVQVNVQNATNPTYVWSSLQGLSCNDCPNPIVSPHVDMVYTVRVYDHSHPLNPNDCWGDATLYVFVEPHEKSYVPNAFTPSNADGINDILYIYGEGIKILRFTIFDRYGELLFESDRQSKGWDGTYKGKLMEPGVYIYNVEAEYLDNKREVYQGSVTLIR